MKKKAAHPIDFFVNLSQLLVELAVLRTRDLRPRRLDLDHYFILEIVATGRAHSEAEMVFLLGRNASFCSRAVDRLVERGWLKKRPRPRGVDSKFQVKITRKGSDTYQDLQACFVERVKRKLVAGGTTEKALGSVVKQVVRFNRMLSGAREDPAPAATADGEMVQQRLRGL